MALILLCIQLDDKERRLELAFQAERSYDVFCNGESLTREYPGLHNAMEEVMANRLQSGLFHSSGCYKCLQGYKQHSYTKPYFKLKN